MASQISDISNVCEHICGYFRGDGLDVYDSSTITVMAKKSQNVLNIHL